MISLQHNRTPPQHQRYVIEENVLPSGITSLFLIQFPKLDNYSRRTEPPILFLNLEIQPQHNPFQWERRSHKKELKRTHPTKEHETNNTTQLTKEKETRPKAEMAWASKTAIGYHLSITINRPNLLQRPSNCLFGKEKTTFQQERKTYTALISTGLTMMTEGKRPRRRKKE